MSRSANKLILIGNVGREPDIQTTASGAKLAHLPSDPRRSVLPLDPGLGEALLRAPAILRAVEDCDRWEVDVRTADGSWVTPRTHLEVFGDPVWRPYWVYWAPSERRVPATGRYVPTEVVQTFYDFLALGPDRYGEVIAKGVY